MLSYIFSSRIIRERSLYAAVLSVILCLSASTFLYKVLHFSPDESAQANRFWWNKAHAEHNAYNIVLLGDSRSLRGLSPAVMEEELQEANIYNFAFFAAGLTPGFLDTALQLLDKQASTKILVLGITPYSLTQAAAGNGHFTQWANKSRVEVFGDVYFTSILDLFPRIIPPDVARWIQGYRRRVVFHEDGWAECDVFPLRPEESLASYQSRFQSNSVRKCNIVPLLNAVREARDKDVIVYGFRPPTTNAMETIENRYSGFDEASFAVEFEDAGGRWLHVPGDDYESYDGSHLSSASARKLSKRLAVLIQEDLQ